MEIKYLKFYGDNCPGCKKLSDALNNTEHDFEIEEYNIDTLEGQIMSEKYMVMSVPVLIKLVDNEEVDRLIGFDLQGFRRIMQNES